MRSRRLATAARWCVILFVGVAIAGLLIWLLLPRPELYPRNGFSTAVHDRNGELLELTLAPDERYRVRLELERIPQHLRDAVKLYEDRWFHWHPGVNPVALLRAAWTTYVMRERVVGASTITMQLARLRYRLETRSVGGKLWQIFRALQLERHYSKNEILTAYLNLAPYGGNIEGVAAASLIYFGKPAADLGLAEALALAVIPQDPEGRNPLHGDVLKLQQARSRLYENWLQEHPVDADKSLLLELPVQASGPASLPERAPHFARDVAAGYPQGGEIFTSLDGKLQTELERLLHQHVTRRAPEGIRNAAMLVVDYRGTDSTGSNEILVEIGSAGFHDDAIAGQVNGTRAQRSPGSALKPFIYGIALEQGLIHPQSLLKDAPRRYGVYTPENFDRGFAGPIKARDALIYSRNVPAVELLARLQQPDLYDMLVNAGVRNLATREHYGLALALGGNEVSMHELVSLYAMLARGGSWRELQSLSTASRDTPDEKSLRMLSPEVAFLVTDMLSHAPRPDAVNLGTTRSPYRVAWKTGTSFAFRDAWTVGITGQYVIAVWVGNFDGSSNPALVGLQAATPLFFDVADLLAARPDFQPLPDAPSATMNLRQVDVCAPTGDLPGRYCPRTEKGWFIPGVSPIRVSDVHRPIRIDTATGLRACWDDANVATEIFAIWPSDLAAVFRQAGYSFRQPPAWHPRCDLETRIGSGQAPRITSPDSRVVYALHPQRLENETIPFQAVTDGEASKVFWFVDDRFLGQTKPRESLFWNAAPGHYEIRAVDDLGRMSTRMLEVGIAQ
jgi:penicillin-binding protein 1C